jgi:signal peptidase I
MSKKSRKSAITDEEDGLQSIRRIPGWLEWVLVFAAAIAASLLIRTYVVEFYEIPSGSMLETIQEGDRVIGEKLSYRVSEPKAGDIITFEDPVSSGTTLIKRVIATGGQTVDLIDGSVYVDGEKLDESYTLGKQSLPLDEQAAGVTISYPYTVPEGYLWVMGDNRTNSLDSRYFGAIPISSVSSRVIWTYWPLSSWGGF